MVKIVVKIMAKSLTINFLCCNAAPTTLSNKNTENRSALFLKDYLY